MLRSFHLLCGAIDARALCGSSIQYEARGAQAAATDGHHSGTGDSGATYGGSLAERSSRRALHRAARAPPEPTECHALGSLTNVSWAPILSAAPSHGVAVTYHGGDNCLKKVFVKPPPPPAVGKGSTRPKGGEPSSLDTGGSGTVAWVPTPRSMTLHSAWRVHHSFFH